jgi:hypothetical protein
MNINTAFQGKVVKPWHDLNRWLAKPYALQPDLNDPLRMAASLAIEIRHLPEKTNVDEKQARESCFAHDVIRDVADAWKHGCQRGRLACARRKMLRGPLRSQMVIGLAGRKMAAGRWEAGRGISL